MTAALCVLACYSVFSPFPRTVKPAIRVKPNMTASDVSALVHRAAHSLGIELKRGEGDALVRIAWYESRFDPECKTGSCRGLWQIHTRVHHVHWPMSLLDQAKWAVTYGRARYGDARRALNLGSRHGTRNHGWKGW